MAQDVWLFHRRDESNGWRMIPRRNAQKINTKVGGYLPSQFVLRQFEAQWRDGSDRHSFTVGYCSILAVRPGLDSGVSSSD